MASSGRLPIRYLVHYAHILCNSTRLISSQGTFLDLWIIVKWIPNSRAIIKIENGVLLPIFSPNTHKHKYQSFAAVHNLKIARKYIREKKNPFIRIIYSPRSATCFWWIIDRIKYLWADVCCCCACLSSYLYSFQQLIMTKWRKGPHNKKCGVGVYDSWASRWKRRIYILKKVKGGGSWAENPRQFQLLPRKIFFTQKERKLSRLFTTPFNWFSLYLFYFRRGGLSTRKTYPWGVAFGCCL